MSLPSPEDLEAAGYLKLPPPPGPEPVTRLCETCLHDRVLESAVARAEAAEARLAEVRQTVTTFLACYGHSTAASFRVAQDLAHGITQVLDRDKGTEEGDYHAE